jgi:phenylpropionate dioxygenase-like ring-hydroxylating dioxygenase large terminal subunit/AcrR family transcriptional regulator
MSGSVVQRSEKLEARGEERLDVRRRRELIEATITSISEHGLSGTTVANFYFRSKDALLVSTLKYVAEEFERRRREAVAAAGDDPVAQLEAIIENDFHPDVCNPRWHAVWLAFWGEARARDDYMRVCGSRDESYQRQNVALFERIAREGGYSDIDPVALGKAFTFLENSLPEEMLDKTTASDLEEFKATCRTYLASVFPREFGTFLEPVGRESVAPLRAREAHEPETLPAWTYRNAEFYELEREAIFQRHWLLVGHASQMPKSGDYLTLEAADERALVMRGQDGTLRAFHNVCLHRASRLVRGESGHCGESIVCPHHGWSYGLDGGLRGVPAEHTFPDLDKSRMRLGELELDEWMGFVFVRFGGSGPSAHEILGIFDDEVAPHRLADMKPYGPRWALDLDVDWKVAVESDIETYNSPAGHQAMRRRIGERSRNEHWASGVSRASIEFRDEPSPVWSERLYQGLLPEVEFLPEDARRCWKYYGLFPRAVVNVTPDLAYYYQYLPLGPGKCRMVGQALTLEDERREMRAARYLNMRITRKMIAEEAEICRGIDAGGRSSSYRGGYLSDLEAGVRVMWDRIRALIPVARSAKAPAMGRVRERNEAMRDSIGAGS